MEKESSKIPRMLTACQCQMEHQQHYKMVPYDATTMGTRPGALVSTPTQLIDIFPTVMELAGVERSSWPKALNGESLVPGYSGQTTIACHFQAHRQRKAEGVAIRPTSDDLQIASTSASPLCLPALVARTRRRIRRG